MALQPITNGTARFTLSEERSNESKGEECYLSTVY